MKTKSSAPTAPCPSAAWMPAPVGVAGEALPVSPASVSPSLPAHTPLPWHVTPTLCKEFAIRNSTGKLSICNLVGGVTIEQSKANAEFIVTACNSHATLKADVERLTGQVSELQKALVTAQPFVPMKSHIWSNGDHGRRIYVHDVINLALAEVGK